MKPVRQFARIHLAKSRNVKAHTRLKRWQYKYEPFTKTFVIELAFGYDQAVEEARNVARMLNDTLLKDQYIFMSTALSRDPEVDGYSHERAFLLLKGKVYGILRSYLDEEEIKPYSAPLEGMTQHAHHYMLFQLGKRSKLYEI